MPRRRTTEGPARTGPKPEAGETRAHRFEVWLSDEEAKAIRDALGVVTAGAIRALALSRARGMLAARG